MPPLNAEKQSTVVELFRDHSMRARQRADKSAGIDGNLSAEDVAKRIEADNQAAAELSAILRNMAT